VARDIGGWLGFGESAFLRALERLGIIGAVRAIAV
jgi:hypothetical protein